MMGNLYLEILPVKNLSLKTTFSPNIRFYDVGQYLGSYTENRGGIWQIVIMQKIVIPNWMWDNQISYRFEKKEHRFDVMGVFQWCKIKMNC